MTIEVVAKKWGNSIGIVVPKSIVEELGLREGTKFSIECKKPTTTVLEEAWESGLFKNSKMTTRQILDEYRKENPVSKWIS